MGIASRTEERMRTNLLLVCLLSLACALELATTNPGFEDMNFNGFEQYLDGALDGSGQSVVSANPFEGSFSAELDNDTTGSNSFLKYTVGAGIVVPGDLIRVQFAARGTALDGTGAVAIAKAFTEIS